jgi:hypothetical protein
VELTITDFNVDRVQIRSLATRISSGLACHDRATRQLTEYDMHPRQPRSRDRNVPTPKPRSVVPRQIPAGHNFEVQHERWIFDMRKASDEA